jgi:hypothetical protein
MELQNRAGGMMMNTEDKMEFEIPEAEIIRFDRKDIIRTSGGRRIIFCSADNNVGCMENAMMD